MDIRTKLVFGLVAVSLGGMLALGALAYTSAESLLASRSELRLASLADGRAEQVEAVVEGWREAVRLIGSRTQLRRSLLRWNRTRDPVGPRTVGLILDDAESASERVDALVVLDPDGQVVAEAGDRRVLGSDEPWGTPGVGGVTFLGFTLDRPVRVRMGSTLVIDGLDVGTLRAVLSTQDLLEVTDNRNGLGQTGETFVVWQAPDGRVVPLNPPSVPAAADGLEVGRQLLDLALAGTPAPVKGLVDYRGEVVWAAGRRIDGTDLGVVVKFDEAAETADIAEYREQLLGVGFSLAAFAILVGVLLGFRFARPIHELAAVATLIRDGELSAQADESREDELGVLARAFNEMNAELARRMAQLQQYKTFFDEARDLLCIARTDGYFHSLNPAFRKTLGWSEEELLERPFVEFVHPDDVEATIRETERLRSGIPTVSFENRYRCADGSYKLLRWVCHPDPESGLLYASARVLPPSSE